MWDNVCKILEGIKYDYLKSVTLNSNNSGEISQNPFKMQETEILVPILFDDNESLK